MIRNWAISASYRLSKWIGRQHMPYVRKKLNSDDYKKILATAQDGDIILGTNYGEFSNAFIPGFYKHAGVYAGRGKWPSVVESIGSGVHLIDLMDFVMSRDAVCVLRYNEIVSGIGIVKSAIDQLGKPYDYEFSANNKAFYCSELVHMCYKANIADYDLQMKKRFGIKSIIPMDFYDDMGSFGVIYESREGDK